MFFSYGYHAVCGDQVNIVLTQLNKAIIKPLSTQTVFRRVIERERYKVPVDCFRGPSIPKSKTVYLNPTSSLFFDLVQDMASRNKKPIPPSSHYERGANACLSQSTSSSADFGRMCVVGKMKCFTQSETNCLSELRMVSSAW